MALLILSFIAGVLTIAAPCVLPFLPVIIGGSLIGGDQKKPDREWVRPLIITGSLVLSVVVFTLLIKASTVLLGVPQQVWQVISGAIIILLGVHYLWPRWWQRFAATSYSRSSVTLGKTGRLHGVGGAVLVGISLGPVFSSCSPTYALIVASVLPASFIQGLTYLVAYAIGMAGALLLIAFVGQAFVSKMRWLSNPKGWFKKAIGIVFIVVGVAIMFSLDKQVQAFVLEHGWYDPVGGLERTLSH